MKESGRRTGKPALGPAAGEAHRNNWFTLTPWLTDHFWCTTYFLSSFKIGSVQTISLYSGIKMNFSESKFKFFSNDGLLNQFFNFAE